MSRGSRQPDHYPTRTRPPSTLSAANQTTQLLLSDDDRDILAGISVMVLAIANRQNLADQPHMQDDEESLLPCGEPNEPGDARCVEEVGHVGPHNYQPVESLGPLNWAQLAGRWTPRTTGPHA